MDLKSLNQPKHKSHKMTQYVGYDHRTAEFATINVQTQQLLQFDY
jgi:hypothetical protein